MSGTYYVLLAPKSSLPRKAESLLRRVWTPRYHCEEAKIGKVDYVLETFVNAQSTLEVEVQQTAKLLDDGLLESLWKLVKEKPNSTARLKIHMPTAF